VNADHFDLHNRLYLAALPAPAGKPICRSILPELFDKAAKEYDFTEQVFFYMKGFPRR
jgi:hypothetical protein